MVITGKQKLALLLLFCTVAPAAIMPRAGAVITCGEMYSILYPCVDYIMNGGKVPGECCSGLASLVTSLKTRPDRRAACTCAKAAAGSANPEQLGRAMGLPGKCGVHMPFKISPNVDCSKIK
ncbi:PREDICTED: non-specific lipid-transfer protein 1-like [Ipomoea nil]|uniref:non-specific lipid-transfer protein 1-like n=1 Tax=Ipomoea nil TaxID=35883 RepID=UPI000900E998|nr:PREDICTED: non-specific lipid-transfer protein 1-like [Ipomoea nil]